MTKAYKFHAYTLKVLIYYLQYSIFMRLLNNINNIIIQV